MLKKPEGRDRDEVRDRDGHANSVVHAGRAQMSREYPRIDLVALWMCSGSASIENGFLKTLPLQFPFHLQ